LTIIPEKPLIEALLAKYRADPEGFRSYLPDVSQMLDELNPFGRPISRSPFGLTEGERTHHQNRLQELLAKAPLTKDQAVSALEHWATLVRDDNLPLFGQSEHLLPLLKAVLGKAPSSFKSVSRVPIKERQDKEAIISVSVRRGVVLELDRNMQLVSVLVNPKMVRERQKLLAFVGAGHDPNPDVALRHDDYLTEAFNHATR
jgi:hypothetical protein